MLYIDSYYQHSTKISHDENGDKAFTWIFDTTPSKGEKIAVFCVLDGVTHTDSAAQSSALAAKEIRNSLTSLFVDSDALSDADEASRTQYFFSVMREALLSADSLLWSSIELYACTASIAIVFGEYVYTANVGDSPIYLANTLTQDLTEIFTCQNQVGYQVLQGVLTKEEALTAKGKNRLLKSIGGKKARLTDIDISTHKTPLPQDGILLLGSDGSLSAFSEDKLKDIVFSNCGDMKDLCEGVYNQVISENGEDDFTLIASRIHIIY